MELEDEEGHLKVTSGLWIDIPVSEMNVAMMNHDVWRSFIIQETRIPK